MAVLAAATLLAVQGCDPGTPAQAAAPGHIVITAAQAQAVYQKVLQVSDDAAAAGAMATGLDVVTNAAWETTHAEYISMQSTGVPVPRYLYGTPRFFIPRLNAYPHWFVAAVPRRPVTGGGDPVTGGGASVTSLMVFAQLTAHDSWALNGITDLAAGQPVPAITRDAQGYATALPTGDQSVVVQPNAAGAAQAAVVDEGPDSPAAALINAGPRTTGLYRQYSAQAATASSGQLDFGWQMQGTSYPSYALRTADGGAVVLYAMSLNLTTEHPNHVLGTAIPVPAAVQPLLPAGQIAFHAFYVDETWEFAAIDPPSSAHGGKLTVIAASGGPTYVHAY